MLAGATDTSQHFGADLYAFEVDYLVRREWAQTAEDVLWRRTKSGLHLDPAAAKTVSDYLRLKRGQFRRSESVSAPTP